VQHECLAWDAHCNGAHAYYAWAFEKREAQNELLERLGSGCREGEAAPEVDGRTEAGGEGVLCANKRQREWYPISSLVAYTMTLDWNLGALADGLRCYRTQEFFAAHEHWESVWRKCQGPEKSFLQALIQILREWRSHRFARRWRRGWRCLRHPVRTFALLCRRFG
jgi:hypothetical protein